MPDYANSKIYVIRNTINNMVYVGSTTQPLSRRMVEHRSRFNKKSFSFKKLYVAFGDIGIEHFYIELLTDFPCERKEQLLKREGEVIRELDSYKNGYNCVIAGKTKTEWNNDNKEKISKSNKARYHEKKRALLIVDPVIVP